VTTSKAQSRFSTGFCARIALGNHPDLLPLLLIHPAFRRTELAWRWVLTSMKLSTLSFLRNDIDFAVSPQVKVALHNLKSMPEKIKRRQIFAVFPSSGYYQPSKHPQYVQ
jgi:hypothetical protein